MFNRDLSDKILNKFKEVSSVFGEAQKETGLNCPNECAKCCFKNDISCAPIELLPMAYHLMEQGTAEDYLERARIHQKKSPGHCLFLDVQDESLGKGKCAEYEHRPFICRAFGLSARHTKLDLTEYSLCKTLRAKANDQKIQLEEENIPYIDLEKKRLEILDPHFLALEQPIHTGLIYLLEKLLLAESFRN